MLTSKLNQYQDATINYSKPSIVYSNTYAKTDLIDVGNNLTILGQTYHRVLPLSIN